MSPFARNNVLGDSDLDTTHPLILSSRGYLDKKLGYLLCILERCTYTTLRYKLTMKKHRSNRAKILVCINPVYLHRN